uniref:CCHC-type domain-containing protein n=1 Tax=Tanacetum cinerariifolium TaxID=118510 RepID=A0A6L2L3M3_TANCI|nr:hypothetical protein [Tanacetum cinerariifolium]
MIDQALLRNSTNEDGSHSSHEDNRRNVQTKRPCFYVDFMKCQPLNFKGTKGMASKPKTLDESIELANDLMDQKLFTYGKDGGNVNAQGWVYTVGNAEKKGNASMDPDSNVVTALTVPVFRTTNVYHVGFRMLQVAQNPRVQNDGNQNQIGNGNLVAVHAEGNAGGNNGNQIRCYNCRGIGHFTRDCSVRPRRRDDAYLQTQLLIAQNKEAGIQLQAEEYDLMAAARLVLALSAGDNLISSLFSNKH